MPRAQHETGGLYAEIAIPLPVEKTFHYAIPPQLRPLCEVGVRVLVPLGRRQVTGYVLAQTPHLPPHITDRDIKAIIDCLDEAPLFDEGMLRFFRWVADYYLAPLGQVIKTALPPGINWESSYHCLLTPEGTQAIAGGSPHAAVLRAINPHKGSPLQRLLKDCPSRSAFFALQRRGLIRLEARVRPGRTKAKKQAFVEFLRPPGPDDALTPKARELAAWLGENGKVPLTQLRKHFKRTSTILTGLQQQGIVAVGEEEVYREPNLETLAREEGPFPLTPEQEAALGELREALKDDTFRPFLLHGVTGSGKTEIYLRAVEEALARGKGAVILVPEIGLTPQLVGRFQRRVPGEIALLHSGLSAGERYDQWRRVRGGDARVVIGTRSAVFAPCRDLGLIIVDEEHDTSYKQEEGVRYNARDLAVVRAKQEGALVVLGSATPSLESFYNAQQGKYRPLHLPLRVGGGILPQVEVVDLKGHKGGTQGILSPPLQEALTSTLAAGGQSLLFLNRRGFSRSAICADCGAPFTCRQCSVSLTYHARQKILLCHYCGYEVPAFQLCPRCGGGGIRLVGYGTEQVEEAVQGLFPQARVARMDSDVTEQRGAHGRLLGALERGEIDILVGTQMIVKGHDFPRITLVGIIAADVGLNLPELRAAERSFQLISQAAGRTGRGREPGRVIIQTFFPQHYAIQRAKVHDWAGFYAEEMAFRQALRYPPLTHMIIIRVSSRNRRHAQEAIQRLARKGETMLRGFKDETEMLGPSPAPLYQIKGRYRWHLLFKGEGIGSLRRLGRSLMEEGRRFQGVTTEVDVDPLFML